MKKRFALLCLLCVLCILTGAVAAPGDAYMFSDAQREALDLQNYNEPSLAVVGDQVYTLWGSEVYVWQPGMEIPQQAASNLVARYYSSYEDAQAAGEVDETKYIDMLLSDGETVYGFNTEYGYLHPLTFQDGLATYGSPIMLDWSEIEDFQNSRDYVDIFNICLVDDFLYMLMRDDSDYENPILYSFNLSTGDMQQHDTEYVQAIAPYKNGMLLLEVFNFETAYNRDTGELSNPTVEIYNPEDGSITQAGTFGHYNVSGIAYYAQNDTLYYTTNSMLMAMPALGEATQVAFMPVDYASDAPAAVLTGGLYAIHLWDGLIVRNTDPSYLPEVSLSVYGGYLDDAATEFMAQYPDVPLNFNQDEYFESATALAQAMVSGDNAFDLYYYDLSYQDFQSLMEKGYCLDLSPYTDITDQLKAMYPFIQSVISDNDVFYAVPTSIYSSGLSRYHSTWEDLGLADRVPTTYLELIEFIQWWADEGLSENPDIQLMEYAYDYGTSLFQMVLDQYIRQCQAEGEDITLNTPLFRKMLTALEAVDMDTLNDTIPNYEDEDMNIIYEDLVSSCLFTEHSQWLTVDTYDDYATPLVLPIEEGGALHVPASVSCIFVNPNSQNLELAVQYIRYMLDNMQPRQHIMMFPDDNEPIKNEHYVEMVAEQEEMLAKAQASLETAAPEDVKDIESVIEQYEEFLSEMDDEYYWDASAESIAAYRELAQHAYAVTPSLLSYNGNNDAYTEIHTLISRYVQKQLSMDQFIKQVDQKLRMIRLERE